MKNKITTIIVLLLVTVAAYYVYDNFRTRSTEEKLAELIHLEDSRTTVDQFSIYLEDENVKVRAKAALAIGRIGGKNAGATLFKLITTDVDDVAVQAAFAIGLTDESAFAEKLLDVGFDAPSRVGAMLVASAGRLADSSHSTIHKLLTTYFDHPSPEVRKEACIALFRSSGKDEADALISFLQDETDDEVRIAGLFALTRMQIEKAYDYYELFLPDADPYVRSLAVRGVALSDTKEAERYVAIALNDSDNNVVAQAISSLASKKTETAQNKLLQKLDQETDEKLISSLISALLSQENINGVDIVKSILNSDSSTNVVISGLQYLATVEKDRAVILIDSLMRNENPRIRAAAADAFGATKSTKVKPRLSALFTDRDITVRASAFAQLLLIDSTNIKFYIDQALTDSAYMLPVLAIDEIGTRKLKAYLPKLREYSMTAGQLDIDVRRTLVSCAQSFLEDNKADTNALRILINMALDKEYIVRKEASDVYNITLGEKRTDIIRQPRTRITTSEIHRAIKKYKTNPYARVITNKGEFEFELRFDKAPLTVLNFIDLVDNEFYENLTFHRVIPNFVAQGGCPEGTGWGGPDYLIRCEYSDEKYIRGTVGIATSGKDTGGSQFFISHSPLIHLEGRYTIFGQVDDLGMEIVDRLVVGDIIREIIIEEGNL